MPGRKTDKVKSDCKKIITFPTIGFPLFAKIAANK